MPQAVLAFTFTVECAHVHNLQLTTLVYVLGGIPGVHLTAPSLEAKHGLAKQQVAKGVADGLVDECRRGQEPAHRLFRGLVVCAVLMGDLRKKSKGYEKIVKRSDEQLVKNGKKANKIVKSDERFARNRKRYRKS